MVGSALLGDGVPVFSGPRTGLRLIDVQRLGNSQLVLARYAARDEGASRLGEVALVDKAGRIAESGSVFFNTLLDENAASHIALGQSYSRCFVDKALSPEALDAAGADPEVRAAVRFQFVTTMDEVVTTIIQETAAELQSGSDQDGSDGDGQESHPSALRCASQSGSRPRTTGMLLVE